jgi:NAD/NADP transhydrogenase alpha subunit
MRTATLRERKARETRVAATAETVRKVFARAQTMDLRSSQPDIAAGLLE